MRKPGHVQTVARLAHEIWTDHYVPIVGQAQVDYMLERFQSVEAITQQMALEGYEYYLLSDTGYLALVPDASTKKLFLSKIYLRRQARGHGYGKQMLHFAETRARKLGLTEIWLTVNKHNLESIAFYEHAGMHRAEDLHTDIGEGFVMDDWRMAKNIPSPATPSPSGPASLA